MKNSAVQIISLVFGTILAAAAQDLSPALCGVKPPIAIAAILFTAFHAPFAVALAAAFVSGMFLDALAGLPALCATSLLPLLALGAHFMRSQAQEIAPVTLGLFATIAAATLGEAWLAVCGFATADSSLLVRVCAAAILAIPTGATLFALLPVLGRHAGLEVEE
jgi:hypothetical protein